MKRDVLIIINIPDFSQHRVHSGAITFSVSPYGGLKAQIPFIHCHSLSLPCVGDLGWSKNGRRLFLVLVRDKTIRSKHPRYAIGGIFRSNGSNGSFMRMTYLPPYLDTLARRVSDRVYLLHGVIGQHSSPTHAVKQAFSDLLALVTRAPSLLQARSHVCTEIALPDSDIVLPLDLNNHLPHWHPWVGSPPATIVLRFTDSNSLWTSGTRDIFVLRLGQCTADGSRRMHGRSRWAHVRKVTLRTPLSDAHGVVDAVIRALGPTEGVDRQRSESESSTEDHSCASDHVWEWRELSRTFTHAITHSTKSVEFTVAFSQFWERSLGDDHPDLQLKWRVVHA